MKKTLGVRWIGIMILGLMIVFGVGCQGEEESVAAPIIVEEDVGKGAENVIGGAGEEDQEKRDFVVILDPGHGGTETGRQAFGYDEKDLNNQLTEKVAKELEDRGITLKYTRHYSEDYDLSLSKRMKIANGMEADLFLSIHHDGSIHAEARGVTVFYSTYRPLISVDSAYLRTEDGEQVYELIGEVGNEEGRKNYVYYDAEGNEAFSNPTHDSLEPFEENPSEEAVLSGILAEELAEALAETGLWNRGAIDAPYFVARRSVHPAVLVEAGFMTNLEELEGIIDPITQQQRAEAIADTVYKFLVDHSEKGM